MQQFATVIIITIRDLWPSVREWRSRQRHALKQAGSAKEDLGAGAPSPPQGPGYLCLFLSIFSICGLHPLWDAIQYRALSNEEGEGQAAEALVRGGLRWAFY